MEMLSDDPIFFGSCKADEQIRTVKARRMENTENKFMHWE